MFDPVESTQKKTLKALYFQKVRAVESQVPFNTGSFIQADVNLHTAFYLARDKRELDRDVVAKARHRIGSLVKITK